jgi:hypothetical protein
MKVKEMRGVNKVKVEAEDEVAVEDNLDVATVLVV